MRFQVYCYFRRLGYIVTRRTFFRDALRYTVAAEVSDDENAAKRGQSRRWGKRTFFTLFSSPNDAHFLSLQPKRAHQRQPRCSPGSGKNPGA
jgi:hypothetical protein